jgi:hypothetical protein
MDKLGKWITVGSLILNFLLGWYLIDSWFNAPAVVPFNEKVLRDSLELIRKEKQVIIEDNARLKQDIITLSEQEQPLIYKREKVIDYIYLSQSPAVLDSLIFE